MPGRQPNIVLVITDNQSADLLGCYGNTEIHSPNLDRLAREGIRFENAYCPNAMCSPCRASIFTGEMPSHHGVHTWLDDRRKKEWPENWNAVGEYKTLTGKLKARGYDTALIGKYHLGIPGNGANGIDHWVTMATGHTLDFHGNRMSINGEDIVHEGHSVEFFTGHAIDYLRNRRSAPEYPFALILAYNGPYGHWPSIKGIPDNRFYKLYADCPMSSVPREGLCAETVALYERVKHTGGNGGPDFSALLRIPNDLISLRNYYSHMSLIDDCVGQIMHTLDESELSDDTLVVFTADHGFSLGHHGYWGHGQATWPSSLFRNSFNVPLIVRMPGEAVEPHIVKEQVSTLDLYSTLLSLVGCEVQENENASRNFSALLTGDDSAGWNNAVFMEQEESRGIRTPGWLYVERFKCEDFHLPDELYDLKSDPGERNNLLSMDGKQEVPSNLREQLQAFFSRHARSEYDLWNGGTVKSNTSRPWLWRSAWSEDWSPAI